GPPGAAAGAATKRASAPAPAPRPARPRRACRGARPDAAMSRTHRGAGRPSVGSPLALAPTRHPVVVPGAHVVDVPQVERPVDRAAPVCLPHPVELVVVEQSALAQGRSVDLRLGT